MAPLTNALLFSAVATAAAFSPGAPAATFTRQSVIVQENFGFDFAEDQSDNTPDEILGEANYKQWVGTVVDPNNSFLNRQYNVIRRVRELDIIGLTAKYGILSKLEKNGLDLEAIEGLLPTAEKLGLLSLVANNQQLLINGIAPLLVEPAPLLLPGVAGLLDAGPSGFYLAASSVVGLDYLLFANHVEIPFVGLSAGLFGGLLLVPLASVLGGLGVFLAVAGKK